MTGVPSSIGRARALTVLAAITVVGGALRFYHLAWGAPYFHFHIDEHFVFMGADLLRKSMRDAALSPKFFMYSPLPMYLLNIVRAIYETVGHPLNLTVPQDEVTYMVLGRGISAAFGTATIPLVYAIAARLLNRKAGLLAAAFLAVSVLHLRDSHFFAVDVSMVFFVVLTWLSLFRLAERGDVWAGVLTGLAFGAAILCKYSAAFMGLPMGFAYLLSPRRPRALRPLRAWWPWIALGIVPLAVAALTFVVLDPMAWQYYGKFRDDIRTLVTDPLTGVTRPLWIGQFAGVTHLRLYWFTNLLWWGIGPALEIWSIAGLVWMATRRRALMWLAVIVPAVYFLTAGNTIAPFVRYAIPLTPMLAVAGGVFGADLIRRARWRPVGLVAVGLVLAVTAAYAAAYMNIFRQPDSRIAAARYLQRVVPHGAPILVEPSQVLPPMGEYYAHTNFYGDYQPRGAESERVEDFHLYTLDTYVYLYNDRLSDADKQAYIDRRLALVDWVILDDSFREFYRDLPRAEHHVVQDFYTNLVAGRLGFALVKRFKVYPSLFGWTIDDDRSELTFRLFDHPEILIFRRIGPRPGAAPSS
jgi:hypothetical protein